jgi:hypothetical protein
MASMRNAASPTVIALGFAVFIETSSSPFHFKGNNLFQQQNAADDELSGYQATRPELRCGG